ncbi:DUF2268 domain-containing protein [Weeksellaceae bacterium KMM 9713]|uniref:DUF2268 domain-containing protein n=1 Tax=Profundicola chukchiensis TaxID=2961959 RepID=A0A9X4N0Q8_9FLAO|nr:DUF2268 domain-containing putative Zn-dependent protease [Profundicola chukchiensis]MDG4946640.1 DUF2268 domain-containing protein [Profundicola chukchiensis]
MKIELHKIFYLFSIFFVFQSCTVLSHNSRVSKEPRLSKIYTSDIENFYRAFDLAINDTANAKNIFKKEYFSKGTKGLKDFYKLYINDLDKFTKFVIRHKEFYSSIRNDISNIDDLKERIYSNFESFKSIYPNAVFPDVYFVIGKFQSNGTISKRGLLIGTEILCRTENTNTKNWNKDILRISLLRKHIPITVSHELVHFNQSKMEDENTTLLAKSMREGSAEFIAELISGETDGEYSEFTGKEIKIWNDFKNDKNKSIWNTWSSWHKASVNRPKNAGYWTGYIICKSYYEQVKDKNKAVLDILSIQNYDDFYVKSKVDEYIKENFGK